MHNKLVYPCIPNKFVYRKTCIHKTCIPKKAFIPKKFVCTILYTQKTYIENKLVYPISLYNLDAQQTREELRGKGDSKKQAKKMRATSERQSRREKDRHTYFQLM